MKERAVIAALCLCILVSASCTTVKKVNEIVVIRDLPKNPSITVMPVNYSKDQIEFANILEEIIMGFKIKIVAAPSLREVSEKRGISYDQNHQDYSSGSGNLEAELIEKYYSYGDFNCEYVLFSNYDNKRIKIVKIETKEILTTFLLEPTERIITKEQRIESYTKMLHESLVGIGIIKDM